MNGLLDSQNMVSRLIEGISADPIDSQSDIIIFPPATLIKILADNAWRLNNEIYIGAQDCHFEAKGAYTGDMSAEMLSEMGAVAVICGHSERRTAYKETNQIVKKKAQMARRYNLFPIICVGESAQERKAEKTFQVLERQIKDSIPEHGAFAIAYEPLWAIGSGAAATQKEIEETHSFIQTLLPRNISILYGGSVNRDNAAEIASIDHVGGLLIGGASLQVDDFMSIISTCRRLY